MATIRNHNGDFSVVAYAGDAKILLAFNLGKASAKRLAGFTIACAPEGQPPYYLYNQLQFAAGADHARDPKEPANSSINAPIHKFRWLHVPGSVHQGIHPFMGKYTYTVTPRYFDTKKCLLPLDPGRSVSVAIDVVPFAKGRLRVGFTRGFTQSQAFVHHFGLKARIQPKSVELPFDASQPAGVNAEGQTYTYEEMYEWLGYTARDLVFEVLNDALNDGTLQLDMFAYDLREPDVMEILLKLAAQGRVRIILDNAPLHHNAERTKPEDGFEDEFQKVCTGKADILRGKFGSFAHDKVLIVSNEQGPLRVLTGSTNFAITGLYVNSNHVLLFEEKEVAQAYSGVFNEAWMDKTDKPAFQVTPWATQGFTSEVPSVPPTRITFSPHTKKDAAQILGDVANRVLAEDPGKPCRSVLFAVMEIGAGSSPVYQVLNDLHQNDAVFSFGISDNPRGIYLYKPGVKEGVLVSGRPASTVLPKPFDQVPGVGLGHQVHHKFIVCDFNQPEATVYCGSSNLGVGSEEKNGDNLLAIKDQDVATVFAIEALSLVDHFNFLNHYATGGKGTTRPTKQTITFRQPSAQPEQAAVSTGWFLTTDDNWTKPYFAAGDLKCVDRMLFA